MELNYPGRILKPLLMKKDRFLYQMNQEQYGMEMNLCKLNLHAVGKGYDFLLNYIFEHNHRMFA
ncbi:hypothetical protein A2G06_09930 [Geobacter anodireducens]|nr:hypothetical protein A2G06_09930 [Geobacter anodireducens]